MRNLLYSLLSAALLLLFSAAPAHAAVTPAAGPSVVHDCTDDMLRADPGTVYECTCSSPPADSSNFMEDMIRAACSNDMQAGRAAEAQRAEKIARLDLDVVPVAFEDLLLLSKIMYAEAGSVWLSDEWKMSVGEVVLNRVASPEFPNTIREVVEQPGQYYGRSSSYFNRLCPSETCARLALRLLEGERILNEPSVVFQANFPLGSGVFLRLDDSQLGATYLCYSSRPELYVI